MSNYSRQRLGAPSGLKWVQILVVAVAANLLGGLVFTLTEGLVPSWVVYPIPLILGLWMLRRRTITGALFLLGSTALFLLIHLPFTVLIGLRGSQSPDCAPTLLWVTLFIVLYVIGGAKWNRIRWNYHFSFDS